MYINNNSMAFKDVWLSCSECLKKSLNQNLQRHTAMNLNEVSIIIIIIIIIIATNPVISQQV